MEQEKNRKSGFTEETETLFEDAVCANECTGLLQGMPIDEADKESYGEIFDYGAEATSSEAHADKIDKPNEKRGIAWGDPAGTAENKLK